MFASVALVQERASYNAEAVYLHGDPAKFCWHSVCSEKLSGMQRDVCCGALHFSGATDGP